jgi:hypothetical protein
VTIDLEDERGVCCGEIHADFPDEPLAFPCWAVFLDPAYAIIVRGRMTDYQSVFGPSERGATDKPLTTADVNRSIRQNPALKGHGFKSIASAVRTGLGVFVKNSPGKKGGEAENEDENEDENERKEPRKWDEAVDGKLTLDKILHVKGDESWGPITKEDPRVLLRIY